MQMLFDAITGKTEASTSADAPEEAASKDESEPTRPAKKRGSHRSRIKGLDQLPVETEEVIPDLVAADPDGFERIGEEVSEQLDFIPAKVLRRITVRPKFRRKAQRNLPPIVAPAPVTPLLGGLPSAALLAFMLVSKYIDHLPLYRQEQIFLRAGVGIPRDLIIHWIHKAISLIDPVVQAIRREALASDYIQVDEWSGATWTGAIATCPEGV